MRHTKRLQQLMAEMSWSGGGNNWTVNGHSITKKSKKYYIDGTKLYTMTLEEAFEWIRNNG